MANDPDDEAARERAREEQTIAEAPRAIARLQAELENVVSPEERATLREQHRQLMADPEFRAQFEAMTQEEEQAFVKATLNTLEQNREQLRALDFNGQTVDEVIATPQAKKERVEKLAVARDKIEDLALEVTAGNAQVEARLITHLAGYMRILDGLSEEQWQAIPLTDRNELLNLLAKWRDGWREECLGLLPIEVRRRFE